MHIFGMTELTEGSLPIYWEGTGGKNDMVVINLEEKSGDEKISGEVLRERLGQLAGKMGHSEKLGNQRVEAKFAWVGDELFFYHGKRPEKLQEKLKQVAAEVEGGLEVNNEGVITWLVDDRQTASRLNQLSS